jgi:hypothetical protein
LLAFSVPDLSGVFALMNRLASRKILILALLVLAILCFMGWLELTQSGTAIPGPFALAWFIQSHLLTTVIAVTASGLLFALSGRPWSSLLAVAALYALVAAASWVKIDYLGNPLTLADMRFFLANLQQNLVLFQAYPSLGLLLAAAFTFAVGAVWLAFRRERRRAPASRFAAFGLAAAVFSSSLLAQASARNGVLELPTFGQDPNGNNAFTQLWKFSVTGERRLADLIEIFFVDASIGFRLPEKLPGGTFHPTAPAAATVALPDMLMVLHESLFDPRILRVCAGVPACASPLFEKSESFAGQYGPLFAHSKAGGTWLSEFALLSGFDWRVFGPGGAHAPLNMAPHLKASLAAHLRALGYRTVAIYPVAGNFLNAREAYRHYGFDEFYAIEDMQLSSDWKNTSDANLFRKALEIAGKDHGKPVFVLVLTIRNHGPHADSLTQIGAPVPETLKSLPPPLVDYLLRLRDSESAMAWLKQEWLSAPRPRVLTWFGDHQPLFAGTPSLDRQRLSEAFTHPPEDEPIRFMTWYEIASNLPNRHVSENPKPADLAFLGTEMLQHAGVPLPPHGAATRAMSEECPLGVALCGNKERVGRYLSFRVHDLGEIQ